METWDERLSCLGEHGDRTYCWVVLTFFQCTRFKAGVTLVKASMMILFSFTFFGAVGVEERVECKSKSA